MLGRKSYGLLNQSSHSKMMKSMARMTATIRYARSPRGAMLKNLNGGLRGRNYLVNRRERH